MGRGDTPHFPQQVPIEGYGRGGFRFAGMSHRGSLLCLPSGIWAWPLASEGEITQESLMRAFADAAQIGVFYLGTRVAWDMPVSLRERFRAAGMTVEVMRTGQAANTYNILLEEGRRVGAALLATD